MGEYNKLKVMSKSCAENWLIESKSEMKTNEWMFNLWGKSKKSSRAIQHKINFDEPAVKGDACGWVFSSFKNAKEQQQIRAKKVKLQTLEQVYANARTLKREQRKEQLHKTQTKLFANNHTPHTHTHTHTNARWQYSSNQTNERIIKCMNEN